MRHLIIPPAFITLLLNCISDFTRIDALSLGVKRRGYLSHLLSTLRAAPSTQSIPAQPAPLEQVAYAFDADMGDTDTVDIESP